LKQPDKQKPTNGVTPEPTNGITPDFIVATGINASVDTQNRPLIDT